MRKFITIAVAMLTIMAGATTANIATLSSATAKAAAHYDCTKKGNANKAACKGAVTTSSAAPAPEATASATAPAKKPGLMSNLLHPAAKPTAAPTTTASFGTAAPSGGHPVCKKGKPCGNSCISMTKTCHKS